MNTKQIIAKQKLDELDEKIVDKVNSRFAFLDLLRKYSHAIPGGYMVDVEDLKQYFKDCL